MKSEYRSAPLPTARSANRLFVAMFAGAYALLLVDCYAAGQLGSDWIVLLLGALADEFNCLSVYSDAAPEDCGELRFAKADDQTLERQFKPPSLRNVAEQAPYMHAGQLGTLREVLEHYNHAPAGPAGHSELKPLNLSEQELTQLEAFLRSLSGPLGTPPELLAPPTPAVGCLGCHPSTADQSLPAGPQGP